MTSSTLLKDKGLVFIKTSCLSVVFYEAKAYSISKSTTLNILHEG